jgi:chemotaxis protein MotB
MPVAMTRAGPATVLVRVEDGRRLVVRLASADFFDPGQAVIRPQVLPALDALAEALKELDRPMRVEGHTDDTQIVGALFRGNWSLSASRAANVAAYLEDAHRIPSNHLSAVGFAGTRPLSHDSTPAAREMNRRIELVVEFQIDDPLLHPGEARP